MKVVLLAALLAVAAAQGTKPLTPAAAQGKRPLTPAAAQGTRPLIPGTAQRTRPPTPGTTQGSNAQSSKKPVNTRGGGGGGHFPVDGGHFPVDGGHFPVDGGHFPGVGGLLPGVVGGVLPGGNVAQPATCRYWCKTPEGKNYCCENNEQLPSLPSGYVGKPGICPIVRAECTRFGSVGPQTCAHDDACYGHDKCCFDRCLEEHVCKTPIA